MFISNNISNFNINNSYSTSGIKPMCTASIKSFAMDTVSFKGSDPNTVENKLKRISGLHDPYSEIVMISDDEYEKYMKKIEKRPTAQSMLNLLNSYEDNLFRPEKEVCEILSDGLNDLKKSDLKKANKVDLHELLNEYYIGAKVSLTRNQLGVLNKINTIIEHSNSDTKEKLTKIFEPVEQTIFDDTFRISPLLQQVREIKGIDRITKKMILQEMDNFPNSRNSADVFIINNAGKTHEEIAEAFVTPSRVSIEHIKPQSCNGKSVISNYLIASKRMNSIRSSLPLDKFIKRNPQIPNYMEQYFNDLVKKINNGGLTYMAISLPEVAETIEKQSKGLIQIEIAEISPEERKRGKDLRTQLDELIQKFCK